MLNFCGPENTRSVTTEIVNLQNTVNSRYLKVVGTIFYKFKLPEVQIKCNLDL